MEHMYDDLHIPLPLQVMGDSGPAVHSVLKVPLRQLQRPVETHIGARHQWVDERKTLGGNHSVNSKSLRLGVV